jgi:hypothetical protein
VTNHNKDGVSVDRRRGRLATYLHKWARRHGRGVHTHLVRGLSYGVGSGAVSILIIWAERRM